VKAKASKVSHNGVSVKSSKIYHKRVAASIKASMNFEGLKPSKYAEKNWRALPSWENNK